MAHQKEINLDEITDVNMLQNLLDQTEDIDDRKAIRNRIQEIRSVERAKRDARLDKLTNTREDMLHERQKKAAEQKARTLAMYDNMSKSSCGGKKVMDIGIYRTGQVTPPSTPIGKHEDPFKEDVLQQCKREAEQRKKKLLAAYDVASRSAPAGAFKAIDLATIDVSNYDLNAPKPESGATFSMSGGVSKASKGSTPNTPITPGMPGGLVFPKVENRPDPGQEIIRNRQKEAQEQKRRLLAAYDYISKTGAGPKQVVMEELRRLEISPDSLSSPPPTPGTTSFGCGISK